jgi:hypothetical protein
MKILRKNLKDYIRLGRGPDPAGFFFKGVETFVRKIHTRVLLLPVHFIRVYLFEQARSVSRGADLVSRVREATGDPYRFSYFFAE